MRDKTHLEQIERWGKFVKENPNNWKKEHSEFIDAQIKKSWEFYNKLEKTENGMEKIRQLRNLSKDFLPTNMPLNLGGA
jgi:hypothetical protein